MSKNFLCGIVGIIGGFFATLFGGWDIGMRTLIIFMIVDYVSGLALAGIFRKSPKSKNGALSSKIGYKGLCKKFLTLLYVMIGHHLDLMLGIDYVRNAIIICFCMNELISIVENSGQMGIPIPKVITESIEVLRSKSGEGKDNG